MNKNQQINSIALPYKHMTLKKGKGFRGKMVTAIEKWCNIKDDKFLNEYKELVEILQNASLMIDDIEDGSLKRRGLPCSHLVYGLPATINSANYYYFAVLKKVMEIFPEDKLVETMRSFIECILLLHEGQGMEIQFRDNLIVPTIEEYKKIVDLKTSTFFKGIYKPLRIISGIDLDLDHLFYLLGQYFQIKDDYINLKCDEFAKLKGFADDITEGKFSFPIIHAIHSNPGDTTIQSILRMHTTDYELKMIVIDYLQKTNSFKYTEKVLEQLEQDILEEMKKFDENPIFQDLVRSMFLNKK